MQADTDLRPASSASVKSDISTGAPTDTKSPSPAADDLRRESSVSTKASVSSAIPSKPEGIDRHTKDEPENASESKTPTPESPMSQRSDQSIRGESTVSDEIMEIDKMADVPKTIDSRPQSQLSDGSQKSLGDSKIAPIAYAAKKSPSPEKDLAMSDFDEKSPSLSIDSKVDEKVTSSAPSLPSSSDKGKDLVVQ